MDIEYIVNAIRSSRVKITDHADEEAVDDRLTYEEIYFSVIHGEVIEDYPNDKPYPSCLILGDNFQVSLSIVFGVLIQKTIGQY